MHASERWQPCLEAMRQQPLSGDAWRCCGRSSPLATAQLVDSATELQQLDALLEHSQQTTRAQRVRLDPLLLQPWQQRPVPYGSRFAASVGAPILQGSLTQETALAEAAHRRLRFWRGMQIQPAQRLLSELWLFNFAYHCANGVRLQSRAFQPQQHLLLDPEQYGPTQQLGLSLRAAGVTGFEYPSVRCPDYGINIALLSSDCLTSSKPAEVQGWLAETHAQGVSISKGRQLLQFRA